MPRSASCEDASAAPGSCVLCSMEGSRPLLVEVQALVAPTEAVPPRRVANGIDRNRLSLVLAVLSRNGGPSLGAADVFVSVTGGVRIDEPGADLAVALTVASAARGVSLTRDGRPLACFGEIGLTGELRYVAHPERRLEEAARFGLGAAIVPSACAKAGSGLRAAAQSLRGAGAGPRRRRHRRVARRLRRAGGRRFAACRADRRGKAFAKGNLPSLSGAESC